mmetsp:Transcript_10466/g.34563  ORF Transcript_10466/g.34563 Transcript_10466/m.34563 type:complete len:409 (+) Transcript_10466:20-1246(+)
MRVAFVHPDLGIGGAERLVVDLAVALKGRGHEVVIYTGHYDPRRCFPATRGLDVRVRAKWLPRHLLGLGHIVFASLRHVVMSLCLLFASSEHFDVVVCDQIATGVPILAMRYPVAFYVHFPDKLLASRGSVLRRIYRAPFDWLEERTTGAAHLLIANSKFTAETFRDAFPSLRRRDTTVLYPAVDMPPEKPPSLPKPDNKEKYVVSLNRYERKKRVDLAIDAAKLLALARANNDELAVTLVVAGGYDERVLENVAYYDELRARAHPASVVFERSVTDERRADLVEGAVCLLYTPPKEHFGIVPLEAMALGTPVIAVNSGGPLETIVHGETGYLVEPTPTAFADAIARLLRDPSLQARLSDQCKHHVRRHFSRTAFADHIESILTDLRRDKGGPRGGEADLDTTKKKGN